MNAELDLEPEKVATADELRARLRRKFPANEYAMLYEVRDGAGFSASRSADAVMVGLWPSRGCMIEGMEIKVSRTDWLRELKKPEKAEAFVPYCDKWWVVAGHADVVKLSELPPTWGLMVPSGKGLTVAREAPKLEPKPIDRSMLAAMLKRATSTALDDPEVRAAIDARVKAEKEQFKQHESYEITAARRVAEELRKAIADFEQASGVTITTYAGRRIGDAVSLVMRGEHERRLHELANVKRQVVALNEWLAANIPDSQSSAGADHG
jgi:hypothetical protein